MLAADGCLNIEDDVRAHIPTFPHLEAPITLAHLMHNTSGIRDMLEIMRLGGVDLGQACIAQDLLDAVWRQQRLNFLPNTSYLYSNSNFMLLGHVVERISGEPLADFLDRHFFAPLGMMMTRHTPTIDELVPGLARLSSRARRLAPRMAPFPAARRGRARILRRRSRALACTVSRTSTAR